MTISQRIWFIAYRARERWRLFVVYIKLWEAHRELDKLIAMLK